MIVVDTHVLSELLGAVRGARVSARMDAHPADLLFTSAITQGAMLYAVHRLLRGARHERLHADIEAIFCTTWPAARLPMAALLLLTTRPSQPSGNP